LRFCRGVSSTATVHFSPVRAVAVRVLSANSAHDAFVVSVKEETVDVRFRASRWHDEYGEYFILVKTDNPQLPTCRIPLRVVSSSDSRTAALVSPQR